jgi:hypothetical protein
MVGKISSQLVVTVSERPGKQKKLQPGNREWVTLVHGVAGTGRLIPPCQPVGFLSAKRRCTAIPNLYDTRKPVGHEKMESDISYKICYKADFETAETWGDWQVEII